MVETHGRAKRIRVVIETPCPRCSEETDERELARNCGLCVSCCIEAESATFAFDLDRSSEGEQRQGLLAVQ